MSDQRTIEDAIVATIILHADFDATNCYVYDRRSLGKGLSRLVVVSYSSHSRAGLTLQIDRRTWNFNVDIMVPWRGELAVMDKLVGTEAEKLVGILANYPRLNGTADIQRTDLTASNTPDVLTERRGFYRGRRHTLTVLEIYNPGRLE